MAEERGIVVSKSDLIRMKVISLYREGKLRRTEAAERLNFTPRHVSRLAASYRKEGPTGLLHRGRGRSPSNKKDEIFKDQILSLYKLKYPKFNRQHAFEMMIKNGELVKNQLSYSCFNRWCRSAEIGKGKQRRISKARVHRERLAEEGSLLQLDGSKHRWRENSKEKDCLIAFIDDATSKVPYAQFHPGETTWACFEGLRHIVETKGIPEIILTDKAGWSDRGDKRFHFSQFNRLCEELGIVLIATSTPETKGRIERLFKTWQDRLIAEMDLFEVHSRADANRYISQCFLREWNQKFTVKAKSKQHRYKPIPQTMDLNKLFSLQYHRTGNRNNTITFEGKSYRILDREYGSMRGRKITICRSADDSMTLYYGETKLKYDEIEQPRRGKKWLRKPKAS